MGGVKHLFIGVMTAALLTPGIAHAESVSGYDEVLAMNPGVTRAELEADIAMIAADTGRTTQAVLDEMVVGARAANGDPNMPVVPTARRSGPRTAMGAAASGGNDGLLDAVVPGCSVVGDYTYSHARHLGVNHGHNAIYYAKCGLVHAPGGGRPVTRISSTYRFASYPGYEAQIRSPKSVTSAQRAKAGAFANSKVGLPYNDKFYANRVVNASSYNCSQLVWASWRSAANLDLSGHNRSGIYPNELRKSPISSFAKRMPKA